MQVRDLVTGAKLVTDNDFVIEQYKKHTDRYKEIKEAKTEPKKAEEKK